MAPLNPYYKSSQEVAMKVLFVTAEAYPFMKVGGLGDVSYALPKALREAGIDIRIIMPKYKINNKCKEFFKNIGDFKTYIGWKTVDCSLWQGEEQGIPYYFIENEYYFNRDKCYGHIDDNERFVLFSKAVAESIKYLEDFQPDIIHCNDWHSALVILFIKAFYRNIPLYNKLKTIFTIHNIAYQGNFGKDSLWMLGIEEEAYFNDNCLKNYEGVSFMKSAIALADYITTVSKSYGEEILRVEYSWGLERILKKRKRNLKGIINGIDYEEYNPKMDKFIFDNYGSEDFYKKEQNKIKLQKEMNLEEGSNIPLFGIVSRLTDQKGLELIESNMEKIMNMNIQLLVNGTGYESYEKMFKHYNKKYPKKLGLNIGFNHELAQRIYAASDFILVPSKSEACGLTQLIAMRYGALPIVRKTGGLKDTVRDYDAYTHRGNGFVFENYDAVELMDTINRALRIYEDRIKFDELIGRVMEINSSWEKPAQEYKKLYESLI